MYRAYLVHNNAYDVVFISFDAGKIAVKVTPEIFTAFLACDPDFFYWRSDGDLDYNDDTLPDECGEVVAMQEEIDFCGGKSVYRLRIFNETLFHERREFYEK
jgi:hypothetical protein